MRVVKKRSVVRTQSLEYEVVRCDSEIHDVLTGKYIVEITVLRLHWHGMAHAWSLFRERMWTVRLRKAAAVEIANLGKETRN